MSKYKTIAAMTGQIRFRPLTPDRLEAVEGGAGCLIAFGSLLLLSGLAYIIVGLHSLLNPDGYPGSNGIPVQVLAGLPFFLAGCLLVGRRRWFIFDRAQQSLLIQSGLFVPMIRQQRSLREFNAVTLQLMLVSASTRDSSSGQYLVELSAEAGGQDIQLSNPYRYGAAYEQAAHLASFLRLPLLDNTTDHPREISPDNVSHPLQAPTRTGTAARLQPVPPLVLHSRVEVSAGQLHISIPGKPLDQVFLFMLLAIIIPVLCLIPILAGYATLTPHPQLDTIGKIIGWTIILIGAIVLFLQTASRKACSTSTVIAVDAGGITLGKQRGSRTQTLAVIPVADILDIDHGTAARDMLTATRLDKLRVGSGPRESTEVIVKAQNGFYTFGAGLPDAEVAYLAAVVKAALG